MPLVFIFFMLIAAGASASENSITQTQLELIPAWDGNFRQDRYTEISISMRSKDNREVSLLLPNKEMDTTLTISLEGGIPKTIRVPVTIQANIPMTVKLTEAGGKPRIIRKLLGPVLPSNPIIAIPLTDTSGDIPIIKPPEEFFFFRPHINSLPHLSHAYATIDALVLNLASLRKLDKEQLQALYGFLAQCGRLVTVGVNPDIVSKLRQGAGCSGNYLWSVSNFNEAIDTLSLAFAIAPPELPSLAELNTLNTKTIDNNATYDAIILLFCFYFFTLLMTGTVTPKTWPVILVILATTILIIFALWNHKPHVTQISWAEMNSGSQTVQFSTLLSIEGTGVGQSDIALPISLGPPYFASGKSSISYSAQNDRQLKPTKLTFKTHLFSENDFHFVGNAKFISPLTLKLDNDSIIVTNNTEDTFESGFLSWNGRWLELSDIEPGSHRINPLSTTINSDALPHKIIANRGTKEGLRLFIPFMLENLRISDTTQSTGWLSIAAGNKDATL